MRHAAGQNDPLWRLPLWRPYEAMLELKVADINNVGSGGQAGAITAAPMPVLREENRGSR